MEKGPEIIPLTTPEILNYSRSVEDVLKSYHIYESTKSTSGHGLDIAVSGGHPIIETLLELYTEQKDSLTFDLSYEENTLRFKPKPKKN